MTDFDPAPYDALVGMIEHELELASEGRLAELHVANEARVQLMARLPDHPPAAAAPALVRAELMNARLAIELQRRREALLLAISEVEHVRRATRGYSPASPQRPRFTSSA